MKFPITREYLQTVTLEDLEKAEKEEEIQKKLSEYIRCVCNEFKQHLSFGIRFFNIADIINNQEKKEISSMPNSL